MTAEQRTVVQQERDRAARAAQPAIDEIEALTNEEDENDEG